MVVFENLGPPLSNVMQIIHISCKVQEIQTYEIESIFLITLYIGRTQTSRVKDQTQRMGNATPHIHFASLQVVSDSFLLIACRLVYVLLEQSSGTPTTLRQKVDTKRYHPSYILCSGINTSHFTKQKKSKNTFSISPPFPTNLHHIIWRLHNAVNQGHLCCSNYVLVKHHSHVSCINKTRLRNLIYLRQISILLGGNSLGGFFTNRCRINISTGNGIQNRQRIQAQPQRA